MYYKDFPGSLEIKNTATLAVWLRRETITPLSAGIHISTGQNNQYETEGTNQDVRE